MVNAYDECDENCQMASRSSKNHENNHEYDVSEGYLSFELGQLLKMGFKRGDCTSMN